MSDMRTFALVGGLLEFIKPATPILNRKEMNDFLVSIPILNLSITHFNSCAVANPQKKSADGGNGAVEVKKKINNEQNLKNYKEWEKRSLERIEQQDKSQLKKSR
jgi:hypothetical protein